MPDFIVDEPYNHFALKLKACVQTEIEMATIKALLIAKTRD